MFYRILTAILPDFVLLKIRYFLRALIGYDQLDTIVDARLRRVEEYHRIAKQKYHEARALDDKTRDILKLVERRLQATERTLNIASEEVNWDSLSVATQSILTHTPIISEGQLEVVSLENQELFRGGIYNPGALQRDGEILLVGRGELHSENERSHDPALVRRGSTPVVAICSYDGHVKSEYQLELEGFDDIGNLRTEDYRLFTFYQGLYASHPIIRFPGDFPLSRPTISQAISRVDLQQKRLSYVCDPKLDRQIMSQEKNWVYLEHDRELYLFYMFYPDFVVNKFVYGSDWEFKTVVDESLFIPGLDSIPFVSYSSSPVDYDESHYLLFVHARSSKTILDYIHWGVLLDKRSLRPVKMTRNPVIRGGAMRGTYPHVVFISGVVPRGADFILFMGEGDSYCSRCIITRKQLENNFITIHTEPRPS